MRILIFALMLFSLSAFADSQTSLDTLRADLWQSNIIFSSYDLNREGQYTYYVVMKGHWFFKDSYVTQEITEGVRRGATLSLYNYVHKKYVPKDSFSAFDVTCIDDQATIINKLRGSISESQVKYFEILFSNNNTEYPWDDRDVYAPPKFTRNSDGDLILIITSYVDSSGYCKLTGENIISDAIATTVVPTSK